MIRTTNRPFAPKRRAGTPRPAEAPSPVGGILRLQRTVGNAAVQRLLAQRAPAGEAGAVSPEVETGIAGARGGGAALDAGVRGEMETAFGAAFGGVRVHTGGQADALSRSLGARAFTTGADVFFRSGEFSPSSPAGKRLLAHELAHVVQQGGSSAPVQRALALGPADDAHEREAEAAADAVASGDRGSVAPASAAAGAVQRDLAKAPPGRTVEPGALTEEQVQNAILFNVITFNARSTRAIQDIVGAPVTGSFDAQTIHRVVAWQADFRLPADGKIGLNTLKTICEEMIAEGMRDEVIHLIVDAHGMPTAGLVRIFFDRTVTDVNARTRGPIPGDSTVRVGPPAFSQGYEGLVHTIRHELEHVRQRRAGLGPQPLREFLAEGIEIMSEGMLPEGLDGFMEDAEVAINHWSSLGAADRAAHRARFNEMRARVRARFNAAPAAQRARHQAVMDRWNAVP